MADVCLKKIKMTVSGNDANGELDNHVEEHDADLPDHPLRSNIEKVTSEQLKLALEGIGDGWKLFAQNAEMQMYTREKVVDGLAVDPLKAVYTVKGVTGSEVCHFFFEPQYRRDWETTLDEMRVLEKVSDNVLIFHQIHKRIWPATQRDAVFWSHRRLISSTENSDVWMVCNNSIDHLDVPVQKNGKYCRALLTVGMVCETVYEGGKRLDINRDDVTCKIHYCSAVNPGGWAPTAAIRQIYKQEYPKFLKTFTKYVTDKCKDKPVKFGKLS